MGIDAKSRQLVIYPQVDDILQDYVKQHSIQSLWSGYGEIARYAPPHNSGKPIIVKHIKRHGVTEHPRGWQSKLSHQRKLSSYENELLFYQYYSAKLTGIARVPRYIDSKISDAQLCLILEDLDEAGFALRYLEADEALAKMGLRWLASFHACFFMNTSKTLWQQGSYWHLDTRPDELAAMPSSPLKDAAYKIDRVLKQATFKTLIHGDAKLANFCFHQNHRDIAAVDFQYVGKGAPVKDIAYFLGSCFFGDDLLVYADSLFEYYLEQMNMHLSKHPSRDNFIAECRALYPFAWADFERFMRAWSPGHKKLSEYSAKQSALALARL